MFQTTTYPSRRKNPNSVSDVYLECIGIQRSFLPKTFTMFLFFLFLGYASYAQTYNVSSGGASSQEFTCSGTVYDNGGTGNYPNTTGTFTEEFCASSATEIVSITFNSINIVNGGSPSNNDDLNVYVDGSLAYSISDASATNIIVNGNPGGCITVEFIQSGTNNGGAPGFDGSITCVTVADAGTDQTLAACATTTTLAGNAAGAGETGTWTVSPAGPSITSPNSPTSGVTGLVPGTSYTFTWTIVDNTTGGSHSDDVIVDAVAGPGCATYCTPTGFGSNSDGYIDGVDINGGYATTGTGWGAGGYQDFSGTCVSVAQGETFTMDVDLVRTSAYDAYMRYWIDWNGDGDFTNDGSATSFGFTTDIGSFSFSLSETVPCDAAVGNLKIRFSFQYNLAVSDPCASDNTWGEFEDYCIAVSATAITTANAGGDQLLLACDDDAVLSANAPGAGETGEWTLISGSGMFTDPADPGTTISGLGEGANQIAWNITDQYGCNTSSDTITITTVGLPSEANAGPDQGSCATSFTMAADVPTSGTGTWVLVSAGSGVATVPTLATTTITGVTVGTSEEWQWQVTNPPCPQVSTDNIVLTSETGVTPPVVMASGTACSGTLTLIGNSPTVGTGTWTCTSGDCGLMTLTNPSSPIATVTGFDVGESATFTWTITGAGCAPQSASTTQTAIFCTFDEPCEATPLVVNQGSCSYTTYDNTGMSASTGMVEPGCGFYAGSDVWFTAIVPETGQLEINAVDVSGGSSMFMGVAIYDGPDCSNLEHAGCDGYSSMGPPSPSSTIMAEATYVGQPGTQVWIRAWSGNGNEGQFNLCAWTHTNNYGDIFAGNTTITCGQSYTFLDPGGDGNYQDNSGANYIICPDSPGEYVTIDFTAGFFDVENGYDKLTILDGGTTSATIVGQWSGTSNPGTITSSATDGCLTVIWQSDISIQDLGWSAEITCSSVPGTNTPVCSPTNCSGDCGQWICADGLYPTNNDGNGIEDLAIHTSGCFTSAGEIASKWFYFTALTAGTIEFTFDGPNGQDYNLAVWGPSMDGVPPCPMSTGDAPIRCSQADVQNTSNPVGLGNSATDNFEGPEGDGWLAPLDVLPGETYAMILNIYMNGNPQPEIDLTIAGTGTLDCSVVLAATLGTMEGVSLGDRNHITWTTQSETNNDYFTLERSVNGFDWEPVGTVDGAGNSTHHLYYSMIDESPYQPVTYYRLKQTDYDGAFTYFTPISVSSTKPTGVQLITQPFPNPAQDYFTITFDQSYAAKEMTVRLVDGFGRNAMKHVYTNVMPGMPMTINTSDIANGVYQLVVEVGEQQQTYKVSIAH